MFKKGKEEIFKHHFRKDSGFGTIAQVSIVIPLFATCGGRKFTVFTTKPGNSPVIVIDDSMLPNLKRDHLNPKDPKETSRISMRSRLTAKIQ